MVFFVKVLAARGLPPTHYGPPGLYCMYRYALEKLFRKSLNAEIIPEFLYGRYCIRYKRLFKLYYVIYDNS